MTAITIILAMSFGLLTPKLLIGQNVSLGFVTGDLNSLAQYLALGIKRTPLPDAQGSADTRGRRAGCIGQRVERVPGRSCARIGDGSPSGGVDSAATLRLIVDSIFARAGHNFRRLGT
jgi:hypothetical protein